MADEELGSMIVRVGLDGTDFERGQKNVLAKMNLAKSELRATASQFTNYGKSIDGLRAKQEGLAKQYQLQGTRVRQLQKQYEGLIKTHGAESDAALRAGTKLNGSISTYNKMGRALDETSKKIANMNTSWYRAEQRVNDFAGRMNKTGENMKNVGQGMRGAFGAATLALGGGLGLATKEAMNFEQQMSSVKSVMAPDEVEKFGGSLEKLAITMGAKTKYSATESAKGIEELVKAGVSVTDIINGGLDGALSLATAGELELGDAAEIASTALNSFKDDNLSVTRAADILAGAANASATSVSEMKYSMSAAATVASGTGFSFEETSAALAVFAQNGLKGSDAGTSLKTMMMRLSPTTKSTVEAFDALGLSAYNVGAGYKFLVEKGITPTERSVEGIQKGLQELSKQEAGSAASKTQINKAYKSNLKLSGLMSSAFYDENGKVKSMSEVAGLLHNAMKGLNDESRQLYLNTMFGSDAVRAGNILYKEGAAGIDNMTTSLNKIKASDVAKEKLNNLKGTVEQLNGSLSTAGITVGTALLPALRYMTEQIQSGVDWFNNLSPTMKNTVAIGGGLAVVAAGIGTAIGGLLSIMGGAVTGLGTLSTGLGKGISWFGKFRQSSVAARDSLNELNNTLQDGQSAAQNFNSAIAPIQGSVDVLSSTQSNATENINNTNEALSDGQRALENYNGVIDPTKGNVDNLGSSESDAAERIQNTNRALNDGQGALEEYNNSAGATGDSISGLADTSEKAGSKIQNTEGKVSRSAKTMGALKKGASVTGVAMGALGVDVDTVSGAVGQFNPALGNAIDTVSGVYGAVSEFIPALSSTEEGFSGVSDGAAASSRQMSTSAGHIANVGRNASTASRTLSTMGSVAGTAASASTTLAAGAGRSAFSLAGLGTKVLGAVKGFGNMTKIVGIARFGLSALGGPIGLLTTVGLPLLITGGIKLYKHLKEQNIPALTSFGNKVSDSTTKAVLGYKKLNDDATVQLNELQWSSAAITKKTADQLVGTFTKMGDRISASLKISYDKSYQELSDYFQKSKALSNLEENTILGNVQARYNRQLETIQTQEAKIKEITGKAAKERRGLSDQERTQINQIQANMMNTAVRTMSKGEVEQRVILQKLKDESNNITARQAADTIAHSVKAKNETVKEAQKKYNATVALAVRERDETGSITAAQAKKIIDDAKKTRDQSIKRATEMHNGVVNQARLQAGGQADQIDLATGKVLSTWDKMVVGVSKAVNVVTDKINSFLRVFHIKTITKWSPKGTSTLADYRGKSNVTVPKRATGNAQQYAKGTSSSGHPGGPAIVGEKGRELAHIPGKGVTMLGVRGSEYHSNLPRGTSVLPNKSTEKLLKRYGFPGYAEGIGDFFNLALKGPEAIISNIWNAVPKLPDLGGIFTSMGSGIMSFLKNSSLDFIKGKLGDFLSFGNGNYKGGGAAQARKWIMTAMQITHTPMGYLNGLMKIADKESSFNPRAINLWDSNAKAGHPSRGLFQTIPSTFAAYALKGMKDIYNPIHNAVAAIRYMNSVYGGIENVPGLRSMAKGGGYVGYASGGRITSPQIAAFAENGYPEYAITTEPKYRKRSLALYNQLGQELGIPAFLNTAGTPSGHSSNVFSFAKEFVESISQLVSKITTEPAAGGVSIEIPLHLDGREIARATAKYTQEEQSRLQTKQNRFEGIIG